MRKTEKRIACTGGEERGASEQMRPASSAGEAAKIAVDYRDAPGRFAREVLGSRWWEGQEEIAAALVKHRRVAVKAANGVGKTYLAADLVLWFLYSFRPSVVLTTAPTWRQVETLLWEEIRRRFRKAQYAAEADPARLRLEGTMLQTRLKLAEGYFAMGLSTDEPVRFQGFHAENLLVVLDEACGVPEEIWDAVEGICVGGNNRVLAISNPLTPAGRFHGLFKSPRWKTITISALAHPNVRAGRGGGERPQNRPDWIPGAVTWEAVEDRISEWCEPVEEAETGTVLWEGRRYRPNALFRIRVLGEFPESADDSLFALPWLEAAQSRYKQEAVGQSETGQCVLAVDVARFGSDETVMAVRRGDRVTHLRVLRGRDTMEVAERVQEMAREEHADMVTVDEVGVGAGVVDRLSQLGLAGLIPINFGARPLGAHEGSQYLNLRAQTYWMLRERFRTGQIAVPRDETLAAQLSGLRYGFTSTGQIQIESKNEMRRRGLTSPDRADALALLFCPQTLPTEILLPGGRTARQADSDMRARTIRWSEVEVW